MLGLCHQRFLVRHRQGLWKAGYVAPQVGQHKDMYMQKPCIKDGKVATLGACTCL
jgi:hypothetical protein